MISVLPRSHDARVIRYLKSPYVLRARTYGGQALNSGHLGSGCPVHEMIESWITPGAATLSAHHAFRQSSNSAWCSRMDMMGGLHNCGHILVRGGAAVPLCLALFVVSCLARTYELRTRAGRVIGAPLLCFGAFSILRCERFVEAYNTIDK